MEREVMLCEDVRRALPLSGTTPDERNARAHAEGCADCSELLAAYDSDARALKAYREGRESSVDLMAGFADAVMAHVASEPVATAPQEAEIIKLEFNRFGVFLAAAAVLMLTVSLGLVLSSPATPTRDPGVFAVTPTPTDVVPEAPVAEVPGKSLSAPRRSESAPTPTRVRRRGVAMPAGGGQGGSPIADVLRDLQRVFPNWDPSGMDRRVPRLRVGEREVRF
jgi:hypothetical protein